jgi:hypothetical protein
MGAERFLQRAVLDTIVPQASEIRLEDILGSSSPDLSEDSLSILSTIRQRDLLFFGQSTSSSSSVGTQSRILLLIPTGNR